MKRFLLLFLCTMQGWSLYGDCCRDLLCEEFLTGVLKTECSQCDDKTFGKTFFSIRPQDSNSARRLVHIAQEDNHDMYRDLFEWGVDVSVIAQRSFSRGCNTLGQWFLFNGTPNITVGIPNAMQSFDVDGRQIGLFNADPSIAAIGTLSLEPTIKNNIFDFSFWFDIPCVYPGFVVRTDFTVVKSKTNLHICSETNNAARAGNYPAGFYTLDCNPTPVTYTSIIQAFVGNEPIGTYATGLLAPLHYGKFFCGNLNKTALASIRLDAGIDFIRDECGFFNLSACVVAPAGNRPHAFHILEPVVGANKSWQIGVVALGAYHFDAPVSVYADATFTHLCKSRQTRLFALKNGPGSQYMLLKNFDYNYGTTLERAANVLAGDTKIGAGLMVDASLMMQYVHKQFFFDLGYNLWIRSQETLADVVWFRNFNRYMLGIKGDTPLSDTDSGFCIENFCTQSNATLGAPGAIDRSADGSCDTRYLDVCTIDFTAPLHPTACSSKLFGAFGYTKECTRWDKPLHMAFEWEIELGHGNKAIDQWAAGFNVGTFF